MQRLAFLTSTMGAAWRWLALALLLSSFAGMVRAEDEEDMLEVNTVDEDLGASKEGSRTDSETVQREEQAIKLDGLSVAEMKLMRESAEKHVFQVNPDGQFNCFCSYFCSRPRSIG